MNRDAKITVAGMIGLVIFIYFFRSLSFYELIFLISLLYLPIFFAVLIIDKIYFHSKRTWIMEPELLGFCFLVATPIFYFLILVSYFVIYPMGNLLFNILLLLLPLFISTLPGFYLASKKNFLLFSNKNINLFPIRLLFLLPGASVFNIIFLMAACLCAPVFSPYLHELNVTSAIILTVLSMIGSFLSILMFKSLLRNDLPLEHQQDFMEHKLYLFRPESTVIDYDFNPYVFPTTTSSYGILPNPPRHVIRYQINDLEIDLKKNEADVLLTTLGALIVSSKALRIFEDNK